MTPWASAAQAGALTGKGSSTTPWLSSESNEPNDAVLGFASEGNFAPASGEREERNCDELRL